MTSSTPTVVTRTMALTKIAGEMNKCARGYVCEQVSIQNSVIVYLKLQNSATFSSRSVVFQQNWRQDNVKTIKYGHNHVHIYSRRIPNVSDSIGFMSVRACTHLWVCTCNWLLLWHRYSTLSTRTHLNARVATLLWNPFIPLIPFLVTKFSFTTSATFLYFLTILMHSPFRAEVFAPCFLLFPTLFHFFNDQ